ncbi:Hypothetical protein PHPALM_36504 [Phytophthora palmivora]|uniref:Fibronectin type-III domain-containing protein n=1 Tax=Phytophthora palmivora TaxID=4796 RepID=A0A2P4WZS3_9STRA|nr:Hypothetical protein PHPALM_36504 [Phytophthora palmivora]
MDKELEVEEAQQETNGQNKVLTRSMKQRVQLPILPLHSIPAGALVVDKEETRVGAHPGHHHIDLWRKLIYTILRVVVYLAPLQSTSREIYFAKHKELLKGNNNIVANTEDLEEDGSKKQMLESLERHLVKLQKPERQTGSLNQQPSFSVFDAPSSDLNRSNIPTTIESSSAASADGQLKKMKQRVKLLPISDDDRTTFWETIRGYERMRAYYHQTVAAGGASTPMGFNMEAAFKKMAWIELETQYVDAAIDEHESNRFEPDQQGDPRKASKAGPNRSRKKREVWMRFVPESFRAEVILEFLQKVENEYVDKFRSQEVDFFPQLWSTKQANETRVRMQNDELVRQVLEDKSAQQSEDYKKQFALLLQRRKHLRQASPLTEEPQQPVSNVHRDDQQNPEIPKQSFALVVVSYTFKNLPALSERTKEVTISLFDSLVGQHFNYFSVKGSRLLLNPSVIEFQDTMKEIKKICTEEPNSSFFMCLSTHGARVTRGSNEGSYVLFSETRLSSEEELVLTAIHERALAEMINDIPCKNKFVALELCQTQEPKDKIIDDAETIRHRIHEQFFSQFFKKLVHLRLQTLLERGIRLSPNEKLTAEAVQTNPKLFNVILMESCTAKSEVPVRANEERVSNFLLRFRDAFRGAAITPKLDEENDFQQSPRHSLSAKQVLEYVCRSIREDAANHNARVHAEYKSQVRTKYEHAAEFQDITHTPAVLGTENLIDFGLGEIPESPTAPPTPPSFVASTLNSISLSWHFTSPTSNSELPPVLGYHIQRRGFGRACADGSGDTSAWKRAAAFQVLTYEKVMRNGVIPPTTVTVYGLATDTPYCFRVRARTAGGWGPFSASSTGYRTLSATSTLSQHETIRIAAIREGAKGIAKLMDKHKNIGAVQRYAAEILATMAIKETSLDRGKNAGIQPLVPTDLPVVVNHPGK